MLDVVLTAQFRRDVKRAEKRGCDRSKLREVIHLLANGQTLPAKYKNHSLGGSWKHHRDCHIDPDWLLLYKIEVNDLYLVRTPTCFEGPPALD